MKKIVLLISGIFVLNSCVFVGASRGKTTVNKVYQTHINGNGNVITVKRDLPVFTVVESEEPFIIEESENNKSNEVIIECDENLIDYIETEVIDGVLRIKAKGNIQFNSITSLKIIVPLN